MTFEMNKSWVDAIKTSLPDYASELEKIIEDVMSDPSLDPVVAHGCALAAALASGNPGLGFEISMDKVLFGNSIREAISKAVIFETINCAFTEYQSAASPEFTSVDNSWYYNEDFKNFGGIEPEKFLLFCLVAAIVTQSPDSIKNRIFWLKKFDVSNHEIDAAAKIASVIPAIGKCYL